MARRLCISGKYLFAESQNCNLNLKLKLCRRCFVVVCLFHNLASHASAFILKISTKKYAERERHDVVRRRQGHIDQLENVTIPIQKRRLHRLRFSF